MELLKVRDAVVTVVVNFDGLKSHKLDDLQRVKKSGVCEDDFADRFGQVVLIYPFLKGRQDE